MAIPPLRVRKDLNADALFMLTRKAFAQLPDKRKNPAVSLADALMSGLALFALKDESLLAFDARRGDKSIKNIFQIEHIPSDTNMRKVLDEVDPAALYTIFKKLFARLQRGKGLEDMVFYQGHYLISNDGTGYYSSEKVRCDECLVKKHKNGTTEYHHSFLGSVIVHPDKKEVIPLCPEPIKNTDGSVKNDCERNASKRLLERFRREHPHMKAIVVEDALASNAPHLKELHHYDLRYIIGIKPGSHVWLYSLLNETPTEAHETVDLMGTRHRFRYLNNVALNESHADVRVNVIEYWEEKKNGKKQHFAWVTDIRVTEHNVYMLMRGARARWKIENETFNTLKNQGYQFEHNFGHGNKNLSTVFALLMMLAFLIDQMQQKCCAVFTTAWEVAGSKRALWEWIRGALRMAVFDSMIAVLSCIAKRTKVSLDTS
jgi:hypothetical protein